MFLAACIQLSSTSEVERNLENMEALVRRAAGWGASMVATPENTPYLGPSKLREQVAEPLDGPMVERMAALAWELKIHLLIGSFPELMPGHPGRTGNTSLLLGPAGDILAAYRKIHMFDVDVPHGPSLRESEHTVAGDRVVVASTPLGRLGMSICYDLRFPELYRRLADQGAEIVSAPAAFTLMTGKDHWDLLLSARALETASWILAPAQWGPHGDGAARHSFGRSAIVDPWGLVVARCGDGDGVCLAEVDLERGRQVRRQLPLSEHRRL